jgi:PadR family transcriptional regulator, regulatory protein PadR
MGRPPRRDALVRGTLDMLILRTLQRTPAHGHDIAKQIQRATDDVLQVEHGSLYPALHRLVRKGLITSAWERDALRNREFRFYHLTTKGCRQLATDEQQWRRLTRAIAQVMWPAEAER